MWALPPAGPNDPAPRFPTPLLDPRDAQPGMPLLARSESCETDRAQVTRGLLSQCERPRFQRHTRARGYRLGQRSRSVPGMVPRASRHHSGVVGLPIAWRGPSRTAPRGPQGVRLRARPTNRVGTRRRRPREEAPREDRQSSAPRRGCSCQKRPNHRAAVFTRRRFCRTSRTARTASASVLTARGRPFP